MGCHEARDALRELPAGVPGNPGRYRPPVGEVPSVEDVQDRGGGQILHGLPGA